MEVVVTAGAEDDGGGGDSWSCKICRTTVISSPPTNQHIIAYFYSH